LEGKRKDREDGGYDGQEGGHREFDSVLCLVDVSKCRRDRGGRFLPYKSKVCLITQAVPEK
jgi:hypothetical protein